MSRRRKKATAATPAATQTPQSASPVAAPISAPRAWNPFHLAILVLLSLALYVPTLRNDFVTDDRLQILQNSLVLEGKNLSQAFTGDVWSFAHKKEENERFGSNYYRPLQILVYTAEYHFFGPHPLAWHLVNTFFNTAVVALVYLLLASLDSSLLAFWAALCFALHPMHSEPVAWIAALPELLCAFFLLLALLFYHRSRRAASPVLPLLLGTVFFLAALFSKEPALLFPAILLCYEFLFPDVRPINPRRVAARLSPFLVVLIGYLILRISALGGFSPHQNADRAHLSPLELFFAIPAVFARYVGKLFLPIHMNYFYAFPMTTTFTLWAFAGFLLGALLLAAFLFFRSSLPVISLALCWFAFTLAPALSLNSVAVNFFTERYLYIPSVGFAVLAASAGIAFYSRIRLSPLRFAFGAGLAAIFLFYAVQTERRVALFFNNYTLLSDTVHKSSNSYIAQGQYASALYDRGDVDGALQHVLLAVQLKPDYELGHLNAGWYYTDKGNYDAAIAQLQEAVRLYPDYAVPLVNLAKVYTLQHNWHLAAETYRRAASLDHDQSTYFLQLAAFADVNERAQAARASEQSASGSDPHDFASWVHLGDAAFLAGQWPRAAQAFQHAAELRPSNALVVGKWGIALQRSGDSAQAVEVLRRALQLQPGQLLLRQSLAAVLAGSNQLADSNAQLHKILEVNPSWEHADQVHLALGLNLEKSGDPAGAVQEYQRALALNPSLQPAAQRLAALRH